MQTNRPYSIVLYGATGFTGKLVAEVLARRGAKNWALAGRNVEKLAAVRDEIGLPADFPLIHADADDPDSIKKLCESTQIVVTTVGPYQKYGNDLVAACAASGTDYIDLNGEPVWMKEMIEAHAATAEKSGARILFSAGFDSIPSDLGVWYVQNAAREKFGEPLQKIKGRVRKIKGDASGGTMASMKATLRATIKDPASMKALNDAFALTPGFRGPEQPSGLTPTYSQEAGLWEAPFVMASINVKNVHRTNLLLDHPYGKDFVYDEMMYTTIQDAALAAADVAKKVATMMLGGKSHKSGEGPSKEERDAGFYDFVFMGTTADGRKLTGSVQGDADPGYGSTSKMMAEAALCLEALPREKGGCYTPAALLGEPLVKALQEHAGLTFQIEESA